MMRLSPTRLLTAVKIFLLCVVGYCPQLLANSGAIKTQTPEIRLIANHLPPYMMVNHTETGTTYAGFEHELTQKLADTLGVNFSYYHCSWSECMQALMNGEVDMAHTLLRSTARETFLEFIEPSYLQGTHVTVFYQRYDDKRVIDEFSDLQQDNFVIGYVGSTVYFEEFEKAKHLLKMDVKTTETGVSLLAAGKIDVLAGFDELFFDLEKSNPNIKKIMKKSDYQTSATLQSHTVISKTSGLMIHKEEIGNAMRQLQSSGVIAQLSEKWVSNIR
ncbi:hypothetical protein MACH26_25320 [Planctobacterium marinum]|uniref:Solute-binding protein family 3/N-terminal domain-containing protein n=2 Tax=Planctobacterium marinum TaxID=1631968 RepID=A0AA48HIG3_9ALTE|nr:hypothetical protein MACH26_25320 [Planctobacterium marinum]